MRLPCSTNLNVIEKNPEISYNLSYGQLKAISFDTIEHRIPFLAFFDGLKMSSKMPYIVYYWSNMTRPNLWQIKSKTF
ncbi:hypothetical protein FHS10_004268 [Mucilaginibacter dorajii]|uniref:Uncharacterized protein n=1 Tax=Mucilaginibacter dorajii TaxID=692994 RepID=A0ABP7PNI5_9SPHI|nr:hypothetical protein [Mucilaginibacter dorajii]